MPAVTGANSPADTLERLLAEEIEGARQLLGVLHQEQRALTGQDPHRIEQIVTDKRRAIAALQQLAMRRHSLGATSPDRGRPALNVQRRSELEQLLVALREQNEINGALVQQRLQHTRQALAVLRGQSGEMSVYDPRGALQCESGAGRSLSSA